MTEPWIVSEDDDLLVVRKPAGVNTHRPDLHAQEGIYELVRRRTELDKLALLHRLDKETSGLLVFGKSAAGTKAVADQFQKHTLTKRYLLLVKRDDSRPNRLRCDKSVRGKKKRREQPSAEELEAVTEFELKERGVAHDLIEARPLTGRTHQVRLHAARLGMPIAGDTLYGGPPGARLFLHAAGLNLVAPSGPLALREPLPAAFTRVLQGAQATEPAVAAQAALKARRSLLGDTTQAFLWIDRKHDGFPALRIEKLGDVALAIRYDDREGPLPKMAVDALMQTGSLRAVVEQRRPRGGGGGPSTVIAGSLEDRRFVVEELGLRYQIDLSASETSSGLFLDQRETRRRLAASPLTGKTLLNAFGHTGSLSVAAAHAGAETLTLDLSKGYLDWARENLRLNGFDPAEHDFIYGDALDWMARLAKKGRRFDRVLIDPPSFSTGRGKRKKQTWSVERDLALLISLAAKLTTPGGELFVSTNLRRLTWPRFAVMLQDGLKSAKRDGSIEPGTLPLDHRSGPKDPPYLKTAWVTLD